MLLRFLDTRPGRESECLRCLQGIATRMIQQERLDAVQICRYADGSGRIVWIEDRRHRFEIRARARRRGAEICADTLVHGPVSKPFRAVMAFITTHFRAVTCGPLKCRRQPGRRRGLSRTFWTERVPPRPSPGAGMSVYRRWAASSPDLCGLSEDVVLLTARSSRPAGSRRARGAPPRRVDDGSRRGIQSGANKRRQARLSGRRSGRAQCPCCGCARWRSS